MVNECMRIYIMQQQNCFKFVINKAHIIKLMNVCEYKLANSKIALDVSLKKHTQWLIKKHTQWLMNVCEYTLRNSKFALNVSFKKHITMVNECLQIHIKEQPNCFKCVIKKSTHNGMFCM
jgi:hypothetical protein